MKNNKIGLAGGLTLALVTQTAFAGGLDRSGQDISALFEDGTVAKLSFGNLDPSVAGSTNFFGVRPSGDVAPSYHRLGGAIKTDLGDRMSVALIFDQPWGADVAYEEAGYPLVGTEAHVASSGLTGLLRYKLNDSFSVHGGLRYITASGDVTLEPISYTSDYAADSDLSYVVGGAFERPDIALRLALTYATATSYFLPGTAGDATAEMPQSLNLDFQTGIAANTLLFGQVRWADWSAASVVDSTPSVGELVSYDEDVITYTLGLGRKFNEKLSGALTLGYEETTGDPVSNLSPTDGFTSVGLGLSYTTGNMKISGGVGYVWPGDAVTEAVPPFPGGTFTDSSALAAGASITFTF